MLQRKVKTEEEPVPMPTIQREQSAGGGGMLNTMSSRYLINDFCYNSSDFRQ